MVCWNRHFPSTNVKKQKKQKTKNKKKKKKNGEIPMLRTSFAKF